MTAFAAGIGLAIGVVLCSYIVGEHFGPAKRASIWLNDFRLTYLTPLDKQNGDVVVLAVNEDTLASFPYRSPIDRKFLAHLVRRLDQNYAVRAIGIDLIFDQPTVGEYDVELRNVMRHARAPLVVATGEQSTGLSARQLAYQDDYLSGLTTGSSVLHAENGVVRTHLPGGMLGEHPGFATSVALAANIGVPLEPAPILFRRAALDNDSPIRVFPAHSIDMLPAEWINGKIVLIGAILSDRDQHRTPLSILGGEQEFMAGVLVHAQILAQIATGESVPQTSGVASFFSIAAATVIGLTLVFAPVIPILRFSIGAGLFLAYWLAAFSPVIFWLQPLPILTPSIAYVLALAAATAVARQRERRQRVFLHSAFNQYVSADIIDDLLKNPSHLRLGGELREMSFIFTDIAGFSTMSERLSPEALVSVLSGYLDGLVAIALEHKGTIARFVGDGLLVFFGAPLRQESHHRHAVNCALEFDRFCQNYRKDEQRIRFGFGVTRIGVHSGPAVVGNVGGKRRFEYTAHGDSVNVTARLEGANRLLGTRVCISNHSAFDYATGEFQPVGRLYLKGKSEAVGVVTPWDGYSDSERSTYLDAFTLMEQGNAHCMVLLKQLAEQRPDDGLIAFHIQRMQSTRPGVEVRMQEK